MGFWFSLFHSVSPQCSCFTLAGLPPFIADSNHNVRAGPAIHTHLGAVMPPLLSLASQASAPSAAPEAATEAVHQVSAAVAEDGAYLLIAQVNTCGENLRLLYFSP